MPCYLRFEDDGEPVIAGTNLFFEWMLTFMTWFHNTIVERGAQFFAFILQREYEPGFPIMVWEMDFDSEVIEE
ncbi:MAG TPA: hypothetical protein VIL74_20665 [Pyrinomonadaceae bacterium]